MLPEFSLKEKEVMKPLPQTPCVSVIMQFEPKMINHSELEYNLQRVVNTVQKQLRSAFQGKNMESTISRLKSVVSKIDFTTFKKEPRDICIPGGGKNFLSRYPGRGKNHYR